ncbi:MAG TPA: hypothetical protein VLY84_06205 [Dysgonamonadaceae bacterium]|nr:hypothetical protein [Dysgonamonadaceae bacterium]
MIETDISIIINRKSDIDLIEQKIIENNFRSPVYILEFEENFQIKTTSDYEEWELDNLILSSFPEYEFTTDLEKGRKEIRLQISRYQSELSTDGWGRRIENPLDETKYLIKKSVQKSPKFNPTIKVLFGDEEQFYQVNIIDGINEATNEKGFLLLNEFKNNFNDDTIFFNDRLYKSKVEAFHFGFDKMRKLVDADFVIYLEDEKKKSREIQKLPRKIIRNFINACNASDENSIVKNLSESILVEVRKNWKTIFEIEGISKFKEYLNSSEQQFCGKDFKIRSSWSFNLPYVNVGIKYYPKSSNENTKSFSIYEQMRFELKEREIVNIIYES